MNSETNSWGQDLMLAITPMNWRNKQAMLTDWRDYTRRHKIATLVVWTVPLSSKRSHKTTVELLCCEFSFIPFSEIRNICCFVLCREMENQPQTSSVVRTPVKLVRLRKSAIRSKNKRTIYNMYNVFKDISGKPEHFSNINIHMKYLKEKVPN
jgi:hypothetical protein